MKAKLKKSASFNSLHVNINCLWVSGCTGASAASRAFEEEVDFVVQQSMKERAPGGSVEDRADDDDQSSSYSPPLRNPNQIRVLVHKTEETTVEERWRGGVQELLYAHGRATPRRTDTRSSFVEVL
ncbi:hypothetical protein BDN72DRAFT_838189 [Pluteus cervinus]|uniref:Uncharacterized protein n=1 Tax=Pluteus cervinus TaxID=181527 RepID=A0ACD3AZB9_9AGAR|nr:hypothetical protein BDN72DRAFT_838189 [Pluteus cervinus]